MIYQQFINNEHWSLAWHFRELGYATTAIHPYFGWFWRRSTVYPLLGFENIFFDDGSLHYIDMEGRYISDQAVSWEIISRYEETLRNDGDRPIFTFAVTMQNHGPYNDNRYRDDHRQIHLLQNRPSGSSAGLAETFAEGLRFPSEAFLHLAYLRNRRTERNTGLVETFAEGLRFSSEAFMYLAEYFVNVSRPTYIIMFGDHAPSPIAAMQEFYASGIGGRGTHEEGGMGMTEEERFGTRITPIVIWSNTGSPGYYEALRNIRTVTPQMLTVELFNITGMPKPPYIQMLENIMETTRGFTQVFKLDAEGGVSWTMDFSSFPEIRGIYDKLRVVQYDRTLGRNYLENPPGRLRNGK